MLNKLLMHLYLTVRDFWNEHPHVATILLSLACVFVIAAAR